MDTSTPQSSQNINTQYSGLFHAVLKSDPKFKFGQQYNVEFQKDQMVFSYISNFLPSSVTMQFGLLGALIGGIVQKIWGKKVEINVPFSSIKRIQFYKKKTIFKNVQVFKMWDSNEVEANDKNVFLTLSVKDKELTQVKPLIQSSCRSAQYDELQV